MIFRYILESFIVSCSSCSQQALSDAWRELLFERISRMRKQKGKRRASSMVATFGKLFLVSLVLVIK